MSLIVDGTTGVTFNDSSLQGAAASPYVLKNRIINGAMEIDQRNAGASVTPASGVQTFAVDRFRNFATQNSKLTVQQNAGSVTPPAGFVKYLGATSSSSYSVISSDAFLIGQPIEGYNIADLAWGTANAKTITISFWVRSSLTGTFGGSINNENYDRCYPFTYTISAANTWEYKTVTIAGDTTGTWSTTSNAGMYIWFNIGSGSSNSGTANTWQAGSYYAPTGSVSVVGTNGATWYITGVQLEIGTSATPFERRLYGNELALCQRYFWVNPDNYRYFKARESDRFRACTVPFPVVMRATPTITKISDPSGFTWTWDGVANSSVSGGGTAPTDGYTATTGVMQASAEL